MDYLKSGSPLPQNQLQETFLQAQAKENHSAIKPALIA